MKKVSRMKMSFLLLICLAVSLFQFPTSVFAVGPTVWTVDSLTKIFRSTPSPAAPNTSITLYAARNEYRAAQIAVRSSSNLSNLSITTSALTGPGGNTISASNISARLIGYIHLSRHTDQLPADQQVVAPDGSMYYPDRITNDTSMSSLNANTTQPIWYSVYIPSTAAPGTYTGTVVVSSSAGSVTVNVSVAVYNVTLPSTTGSTYKVDNWFASEGWDESCWKAVEYQYGVTKWSPQWWTVMTNFAKYMKTHRNNVIWLDPIGCLEQDCQIDANGSYTFNWTKFDSLVQKFIDEGAMKYIHGVSLMSKVSGRFNVKKLEKVNGVVKTVSVQAQSTQANEWFNIYLPALKNHLNSKGWLNIFYQSGGDEPTTDTDRSDDSWIFDKIHSLAPGIKTIEANFIHTNAFEGKLDTYVIKQDLFDQNRNYYKDRQDKGDEAWLYICNYPAGNYLGRYIDCSLAKVLLPHWYTYKNGLGGYLHWGFNYWGVGTDVINEADSTSPGDCWLVYPDKNNLDLFSSIRSEIQLEGIQDRELLELLANSDKPDLAKNIASSLIYNATNYNVRPEAIIAARKAILDNLTANVGNMNFTDNCSDFSNIYNKSANLVIANTNPEVSEGDAGRICKSTNTDEYIVYNKNNIRSFTAKMYYEGSKDVDFYASPDNNTWELLSVTEDTPIKTQYSWYRVNKSCANIPWGTNYLKIVFRNTNTYTWVPQLGQITITHGYGDSSQNVTFKDTLDDYSNVYSRTANMGRTDGYPNEIAEGDASRACRSTNTNESFVYKRKNIKSFRAKFFYEVSNNFYFYTSNDGINWTQITPDVGTAVPTSWGWNRVYLSKSGLTNANYLKIELLSTNAYNWVPQVGEIEITYNPN